MATSEDGLLIRPSDRLFVAGHRGMAGSAICRALQRKGYGQILTATRQELDLEDGEAVRAWFEANRPQVVVLAAAKVGGIHFNDTYPADFLLENLKIQTNVIESAWRTGTRRLLFLGSSCIYPRACPQPIKEEALLTGPLEPTNEWYAIAKIAGIQLCQALRRQHGFDAISLMPTNLYGPGDNFHPTHSHVMAAMIRRFHEAKQANSPSVTCWGTGTPLREFLHADDLGEACVHGLEHYSPDPSEHVQHLNVGTGVDLSIKELAELVARTVGYTGEILWDSSMPDGSPRKQLDVSRMAAEGWRARIPLADGLASTYALYAQERQTAELDGSGAAAMSPRNLLTGGAGFIGGAMVRRLLADSDAQVFNLDKMGYASDLTSIEALPQAAERHTLLRVDLTDAVATAEVVRQADPDLVLHLAAEIHVDRSIDGPAAFIDSNVSGTFHLLQAVRAHWEGLPAERRDGFRFHHISTDEVFGSLGATGRFSETTPYDPRSPYSASKAASDHLVSAWHHTYGLPVVLTNCSNNYGPWQFPEKLIPVVILKAAAGEPIPLYGDGQNVRDWLYVEDHVDALLLTATQGTPGRAYCVGGHGERTNKEVVEAICSALDDLLPAGAPYSRLVTPVTDRPGHDRRYAIDPTRISNELGWQPRHSFEEGLAATVLWFLANQGWLDGLRNRSGYGGQRLGLAAPSTAPGLITDHR